MSETRAAATHDVTMRNNVVRNCNQHGIVIALGTANTDGSSVYNINATTIRFMATTTACYQTDAVRHGELGKQHLCE